MARPKEDPNRRPTRDRIVNAAERAFSRGGYRGATLEKIAKVAGVTRPSLLYHFRTKDELYAHVVDRAFRELESALDPTLSLESVSRVDAIAGSFARFAERRPSIARLLLFELLAVQGPGQDVVVGHGLRVLERVMASIPSSIDQDLLRAALLSTALFAFARAAAGPKFRGVFGSRDYTEALSALMLGGDMMPTGMTP